MDNKFAVRAVIIDDMNNTAILNVKGANSYFKIPGGGIEKGETIDQALEREVAEEAGCKIRVLKKLGEHQFYVKEKDRNYHSICFLAELDGDKGEPQFDDWEKSREFKLEWLNIEDAIKKFESSHPENEYEKIIQNRDLNFLREANKQIKLREKS